MRIRLKIIHIPTLPYIDGVRVDCYRVGNVYDVSRTLAEIFLAEGWAEPAAPHVTSQLPPLPIPLYAKS
jgi:hypothetical protein